MHDTVLQQHMGQSISIIGHPLPSMALAGVVEKQLRKAFLQAGFLGLGGNRPGKVLVSFEWVCSSKAFAMLAVAATSSQTQLPGAVGCESWDTAVSPLHHQARHHQ